MNKLQEGTLALARASDGNPVLSTLTVMLFWIMFKSHNEPTQERP